MWSLTKTSLYQKMLKEINVESLCLFSKNTSKIYASIYKIQTQSPKVFSESTGLKSFAKFIQNNLLWSHFLENLNV